MMTQQDMERLNKAELHAAAAEAARALGYMGTAGRLYERAIELKPKSAYYPLLKDEIAGLSLDQAEQRVREFFHERMNRYTPGNLPKLIRQYNTSDLARLIQEHSVPDDKMNGVEDVERSLKQLFPEPQ